MLNIIEKKLTDLSSIHTLSYTKNYIEINSLDELSEVYTFVKKNNYSIQIIGVGTNILFTKETYNDILFIKLGKSFKFFNMTTDKVEIGGASSFMRSGKQLVNLGYKNFLYMALIPGTLGGGVRQNAGTTKEGEVKDNLVTVKVYDFKKNKILILKKNNLEFSYRNSIIQKEANRYLVISVTFNLGDKVENIKELQNLLHEKQNARRLKQPSGYSFGSTFKSLLYEKPAWWYIKECGFSGYSLNGAKFSEKHANWIINFDNAKAEDIEDLISIAQVEVYKKYGIKLETEVEFI